MATIIKRDDPHGTATGAPVRGVSLDMWSFNGQADEYLQEVRAAAAKIVQDANAEAAAIRQRAEQAGRDAAQAAIHQMLDDKVAAQIRTLRPALDQVAQELRDARGQWLTHWHRTAVVVAREMAERILRREVQHDVELPLTLVREALDLAAGMGEVTIRMSVQDYDNLKSSVQQIVESLSTVANARVVADESVDAGSCLVTTQFGEIDQRISTQLARLEEELTA